jgi:hypothetical protein
MYPAKAQEILIELILVTLYRVIHFWMSLRIRYHKSCKNLLAKMGIGEYIPWQMWRLVGL